MSCEDCAIKGAIERLRQNCRDCRRCDAIAGNGQISLDAIRDGTAEQILDVVPDFQTSYMFEPYGDEPQPDEQDRDAQPIRDVLRTFVSCIAQLPYTELWRIPAVADTFRGMTFGDFEIAAHLIRGGDLASYAHEYGLTRQTAHARFKSFFRSHPLFRSIKPRPARGKRGENGKRKNVS